MMLYGCSAVLVRWSPNSTANGARTMRRSVASFRLVQTTVRARIADVLSLTCWLEGACDAPIRLRYQQTVGPLSLPLRRSAPMLVAVVPIWVG
jgi:hypothetical protein